MATTEQQQQQQQPLKLTPQSPEVLEYMSQASKELGQELAPPKDVFYFADNPELTNKLLALALSGAKTTTTSWPIPEPLYWGVGDLSVSLDGSTGKPAMIMRTSALEKCKFLEVGEEHARGEAEDDGSLEMWRQEHRRYYSRQKEDVPFSDGVEVLCERFEVIYPIAGNTPAGVTPAKGATQA